MHILFVPVSYPSDHAPADGVFVRDQVDCARRQGHQVGVAYVDRRSLREFRPASFARHHFQIIRELGGPVPVVRWNPWNIRGLECDVTRVGIRRAYTSYEREFGRPDLVHAHFGLYGGVAALEIKNCFGVPFVITEHSSGYARGLVPQRMIPILQDVFGAAERVVVVSNALGESIKAYSKHAVVIPNCVDTDFFGAGQSEPGSGFEITSVGSLTEAKGFDILLDAYARLASDQPTAHLNIVGKGALRGTLQSQAESLGISNRVSFHGQLSRRDLRELLMSSQLFVSASRVETFGVAIAEAMSCGLPVIVTGSGGPQDIVASPSLGTIVPGEDAAGLAFEMARAFASRPDLDMSRAAYVRASITAAYGPEAVGTKLTNVYREAVEHNRGRHVIIG